MTAASTATNSRADSMHTLNWLALSLTPGIGAGRGLKLVELFDGVGRLFSASLTELEAAGIPASAAQSLALGKSQEPAAEELDRIQSVGAAVVSQDDPACPRRLYEIYDPPLLFYMRGSVEVISQYGLAVVCTRHPTPFGWALQSACRRTWRRTGW